MSNEALGQMHRLTAKIEELGGKVPEPWPWAIIKESKYKGRRRVRVDMALWNLQLLETLEKLQKENRQ